MSNSLWRVEGKGFVAGLYMIGDTIDHAAPIIRWTVGRTRQWLREYAPRAGWVLHEVALESVPDEYRR
jgi:hypothetical protein